MRKRAEGKRVKSTWTVPWLVSWKLKAGPVSSLLHLSKLYGVIAPVCNVLYLFVCVCISLAPIFLSHRRPLSLSLLAVSAISTIRFGRSYSLQYLSVLLL